MGVWSGLVVRLGGASSILLGPEGTSPGGVVSHVVQSGPGVVIPYPLWVWVAAWCGVVGWPLFENCTVDASIFVVKLPRADGGCLGTRSR